MTYIRVVFFDPATMDILGYARLDKATAETVTDEATGGVEITMALKMWDPTANDNTGAFAASSIITELQQNTATAVSTLVYLDGEELTNADVANVDLTGTMNIQFSSTADLQPMEYGDLQSASDEYKATVNFNGTQLESKTVAKDASYTYNLKTYAESMNYNLADYTIKIEMGGQNVTEDVYDPDTGILNIEKVTGNVVVTVTSNQQS